MTRAVGPGQPPRLAVTPASLTFSGVQDGAQPAARTLAVANDGGGTLGFTASDDAAWLSVSPGSGGAPQSLTVTAEHDRARGRHVHGNVTVAAPGRRGGARDDPRDADRDRAGAARARGRAGLAGVRGDRGRDAPAAKTLASPTRAAARWPTPPPTTRRGSPFARRRGPRRER